MWRKELCQRIRCKYSRRSNLEILSILDDVTLIEPKELVSNEPSKDEDDVLFALI